VVRRAILPLLTVERAFASSSRWSSLLAHPLLSDSYIYIRNYTIEELRKEEINPIRIDKVNPVINYICNYAIS